MASFTRFNEKVVSKVDLFEVNNSQYHLRNSEFVVPRFQTVAFGKHSISYFGPVIWSKLSHFIRSSESIDIFKKCIKSVELSNLKWNSCKVCFLCNS